jgi:transcriptional regulator with XRE-family HTH domain
MTMSDTPQSKPDWAAWIFEAGRQVRRAREFLGLSQEQLARLSGVSQGAVSRVEAGRGMATPILTFLKVHMVIVRALKQLDPALLTDDVRCMLDVATQLSPPVAGVGYELFPILRDPVLDRLIHVYQTLSERERQGFLSVLDATAASLASDPSRLPVTSESDTSR